MTDEITIPTPICGYVRLSRQERQEPGEFEEKVQRHREILLRWAHAAYPPIPLRDEDIVVEIRGGDSLARRPVMQAIIRECKAKRLKKLVAMSVDRITRNTGDGEQIADSFFATSLDLLVGEGRFVWDENFDSSVWDINTLRGQWERQRYSFRRKAHNERRAEQGALSCGFAPYGYRWHKPRYTDSGQLISPGQFTVDETEYPVVEEIFRRLAYEGAPRIARDLTERFRATGSPAPPSHNNRRFDDRPEVDHWSPPTINRMATNPFYAGFPSHRFAVRRGQGRVRLSPEQVIRPHAEQQYPHPVPGLDAWHDLQARIAERAPKGLRRASYAILTGKLLCGHGGSMFRAGKDDYGCACKRNGHPHPGTHVVSGLIESAVARAIVEAFQALPAGSIPARLQQNRKTVQAEYSKAARELSKQEGLRQSLIEGAALIARLYGEAELERQVRQNSATIAELTESMERLRIILTAPDPAAQLALIDQIRSEVAGGDIAATILALWDVRDVAGRKRLVDLTVESVTMDRVERARAHARFATVRFSGLFAVATEEVRIDIQSEVESKRQQFWVVCDHCGETFDYGRSPRVKRFFCTREHFREWKRTQAFPKKGERA